MNHSGLSSFANWRWKWIRISDPPFRPGTRRKMGRGRVKKALKERWEEDKRSWQNFTKRTKNKWTMQKQGKHMVPVLPLRQQRKQRKINIPLPSVIRRALQRIKCAVLTTILCIALYWHTPRHGFWCTGCGSARTILFYALLKHIGRRTYQIIAGWNAYFCRRYIVVKRVMFVGHRHAIFLITEDIMISLSLKKSDRLQENGSFRQNGQIKYF